MKKKVKEVLGLITIMLLILSVFIPAIRSEAAVPRIMVTEYSLSQEEIYPGDEFTLTFKLKNTWKNAVSNIKCTVSTDNGEFIPVNTAGTNYVSEIPSNEEIELSCLLKAAKKLDEKSYKVNIKLEYDDWNNKYEVKDKIYIPVTLKTEVIVSETYIAEEEIRLGDNIEVVSTINNIGGADIYKVTATATGDNIADSVCYVGTVDAGKSGNIDIITKATAVSKPDTTDNKLVITYEDSDGKEYSEEVFLGNNGIIDVLEQDYSDIIEIKEDNSKGLSTYDKLLICGAVLVALILIIVVRKAAKRRQLEKELD